MNTLQHKFMLLTVIGASALCMAAPVQAQHAASDGVSAQAAAVAPAPGRRPDLVMAQAFDTALQAYERCHWAVAFEQLLGLAEDDHVQAARMALQMHRYGPALYGQAFGLSPLQHARLVRLQVQTPVVRFTLAP